MNSEWAGHNKVLMIGLDGYESTVAEKMIARGELPTLSHIREISSCVFLDHGAARRTGLASEHFSSGL